jgi:hypothetical protein
MDCEEGEEWNFAYVLLQPEGEPIQLVIPTSLQMGWVELPPYFCAVLETARDVSTEYISMEVGSLPTHNFEREVCRYTSVYSATLLPCTRTFHHFNCTHILLSLSIFLATFSLP